MKIRSKCLILIIVFVTALQSYESFAQTLSWQWAKSAGSTGSEMATATALDASGNLYVTGWYTSANITFGSTTLVNSGNLTSDIFLVKYDAAGNVIWAKSYGGSDGDLGNGVAVDQTGNVYITGWYASASLVMNSYTLTNSTTGSSDIFIAKIDAAGNAVWAKTAGGNGADRGYSIALDASGNIFTTGGFASTTINFGTGNLTNVGSSDFFVVKHDQNGNALWARSAGGSGNDIGYGVATDAAGDVYMTGMFVSSAINFGTGALTNAASGSQDLFVVKYNGSGTAVWSDRSGGSMDDFGNGIAVRSSNVYVTGGYNSASIVVGTVTLTNSSAGTSDVMLAKYNSSGNVQWARRSGGSDSEAGNGVSVDSAGNVYFAGFFTSNSLTFGTTTINNSSPGYREIFVAAYDAAGTAAWAIEAGSSFDEAAYGISVDPSGLNVYIGGMFNSPSVAFGTTTLFKGCGDDVMVAKLLGSAVGIREMASVGTQSVYPNPTQGRFKIGGEGEVIFYNALGETILTQKLVDDPFGENEFDFSSRPKGIYLYRIFSDGKKVSEGKVVIE